VLPRSTTLKLRRAGFWAKLGAQKDNDRFKEKGQAKPSALPALSSNLNPSHADESRQSFSVGMRKYLLDFGV